MKQMGFFCDCKAGGIVYNIYNNNCFYQMGTVINALKYVKTKYVIKMRIDSYFSNMNEFIDKMKAINKIICSSVFIRGFTNTVISIKFHPSDILFGGLTEKIRLIFKLAKRDYRFDCSEVKIWKPYIIEEGKKKNISQESLENNNDIYLNHMCNIFDVFSIELNKPYSIKGNTDLSDNKRSTKEYFMSGGIYKKEYL
jgi:hypothetical protein